LGRGAALLAPLPTPIQLLITPPAEEKKDQMATTSLSRPHRWRAPRRLVILGAALLVAAGSYGVGLLVTRPSATPNTGPQPAALVPIPGGAPAVVTQSLDQIDRAVKVWSANLARDDKDFVSATYLAELYYSRARLTGNVDDYSRAKEAVTLALAAYPGGIGAQILRAQLLFATHDFANALSAARAIYRANPDQVPALATVGDAQLELGQYDAAARSFDELARRAPGAAVTARLAHVAALRGHDAQADALAARAIREAAAVATAPADRSWYEYLAGYLAFQFGELTSAERDFRAAVADWPGSYLALAGLAKTRAAQGATAEAITFYQRAIAIVPQPEFLAGLGDLYAMTGRSQDAAAQYATVRAIADLSKAQAQLYNRQLVLFDANHGKNLAEGLTLAERELAVRKDVYGYDAYAWALYASGRYVDADRAMLSARAEGTVDALLDYHQGMIDAALGRADQARQLLTAALQRNPGFDPLQAARARATLATLDKGTSR
jgi:tetratricopeptide (TPR) repeat protein